MAVNVLLSFAFHFGTDLGPVRRNLVCGNMMIDSGAFTAWSKGKPIKLDAYAAFLEKWRGCWDHAITLDVIGDGAASAVNTRKLHARGLPVMPVFTRGDKLPEFDAMVREVGYVCVGGLVGLPSKAQAARVGMLQRRAAALGGGVHALGVGSLETLRACRPYSADASNISGAFRFGSIVYFNGRQIVSCQVTDRARLLRDRTHLLNHGIDVASLARTGRMPKGQGGGRGDLMQAMSLAYAAADEQLKNTGPVPAPGHGNVGTQLYNSVTGKQAGIDSDISAASLLDRRLHPGPHLYNSITPEFGLQPAAGLDRALHHLDAVDVPPLWRIHGRRHICPTRTLP